MSLAPPRSTRTVRVLSAVFTSTTRLASLAVLTLVTLGGCDTPASSGDTSSTSTPSATPSTVAPVAPAKTLEKATEAPPASRDDAEVRLLVAGDVIAHRPVLVAEGALSRALWPLEGLFGAADGVLVNHESATGETPTGRSREAELAYAAPPGWTKELAHAHVTSLGLANNHACDLGRAGLLATVASAKDAKLSVVGGGEDPWRAQTVASRGGHEVCAVAWSTLTNGDPKTCDGALAFAPEGRAAEARVREAIAGAKKRGCGAVVAVVHIGEEYKDQPPSVYALGGRLAEAGADAVVMHHPHVVSPLKTHTTSDGRVVPVFASVGNLVTNQGYAWRPPRPVVLPDRKQVSANSWTRIGMIAELAFSFPEGAARPTLRYGYHVVWNDKPKLERRGTDDIVARLVSPSADTELMARFALDREGPNVVFQSPCWIRDGKRCEGSVEARATTASSKARRKGR